MSCKTIIEKRGKYTFKDENGKKYRFQTLKEAVAAGGIAPEKEVQVSGVPYTVPVEDVNLPSKIEEEQDESLEEEDGED